MAPPLRPTLGILLAPPVVGCVAYLFLTGGVSGGKPDLFAQALLGYGLLQLLLLVRLLPWILQQPFGASYWAFSFGVTALAFDAIVFVVRGQTGYIEWLSMALFGLANVLIAVLVAGTLWRLLTGKLLPPPLAGLK
jgi:tellurite resistance protein